MSDLYIEDSGDRALGKLRDASAYPVLRLLIDILFWIGLVGGVVGFGLYFHFISSLPQAVNWVIVLCIGIVVMQVLLLVVLRGLALALLDIADAQLQQIEGSRRITSRQTETSPR